MTAIGARPAEEAKAALGSRDQACLLRLLSPRDLANIALVFSIPSGVSFAIVAETNIRLLGLLFCQNRFTQIALSCLTTGVLFAAGAEAYFYFWTRCNSYLHW